jgi:glutathione S-transferase
MAKRGLLLVAEDRWTSPYVLAVWAALHVKKLAFEVREISLSAGEQRAPELHAGLTARVPMLFHDDFVLSESSAIVEYLDEVFEGEPLLPTLPRERARARQVMHFIRSDLMPIREERSTETLFLGKPIAPLSPAAQDAAGKLFRAAAAVVAEAPAADRLFSMPTIADVDLAMVLMRLIGNGDAVPEPLTKFATAVWARPYVQSFVQHVR